MLCELFHLQPSSVESTNKEDQAVSSINATSDDGKLGHRDIAEQELEEELAIALAVNEEQKRVTGTPDMMSALLDLKPSTSAGMSRTP